MSGPPLVPSPLYGLRTWSVVGADGDEQLAGTKQTAPWPKAGAWLKAMCARTPGHAAPAPDCGCGIHGWHPSRRSAKRVLAIRREVPGVVEARGVVELHLDGFRAEEARPLALVLAPGANAGRIGRLAAAYDAEVVPVDGPKAVLAWCRARGLGLEPTAVDRLLGPERLADLRRRTHRERVRIAAALAAIGVLLAVGLAVTADPGHRTLYGRTGEVRR